MNARLDAVAAAARSVDVLLIDGGSGAGKTSLAAAVESRLHAQGLPAWTLHVEDLYPGWDGLAEGSRAVAAALAAGEYRSWDWANDRYGAAATPIPRASPLIIEGCGAITAANIAAARAWALDRAAHAVAAPQAAAEPQTAGAPEPAAAPTVLSLWIELPAASRKARALARDGDTFAPHWERWAAQEAAHASAHDPRALADRILA